MKSLVLTQPSLLDTANTHIWNKKHSPVRVGIIRERSSEDDLVAGLSANENEGVFRYQAIGQNGTPLDEALKNVDVIVLVDRQDQSDVPNDTWQQQMDSCLDLACRHRLGAVILTARPWAFAVYKIGVVCLRLDSSPDTIQGALVALARMRPAIRRADRQFTAIRHLSRSLKKRYSATNRELQLASRLQRDFLPRESPQIWPLTFTTLFRPCSWVSGDIFDIFRLDEQHWGFYLADAVGHGVAAGLLTMYIKHAIRTKRIRGDGYELVPPGQVLQQLNQQLIAQHLPDSQFITGWYGLINVETLVLTYAVAGHPPALLIDPAGEIRELRGAGCLMGLNADEVYQDESIHLKPGLRVMVYSDGLEPTLITQRRPQPQMPIFHPEIPELLRQPASCILSDIRGRLDNAPGSLVPIDDVSALIMDVTDEKVSKS